MTTTATLPAIETLRPGKQWVCFNADKIPISPGTLKGVEGALVEGNDNWETYEQATEVQQQNTKWLRGVGREFIKSQGITGVDLDKCIDKNDNLSEWARYVVNLLNSYTEISPSGRGLHIWVYGTLPENIDQAPEIDGDMATEAYDSKRYFTITELHFEGTPTTIEHRQEQLTALYEQVQERRKQAQQAKQQGKKRTQDKPITPARPLTGDTPYGLRALENECHELASTLEGGRNRQLNTSAYALGQLVAGNELMLATVERELTDAARRSGLREQEIENTLRSGIEAGRLKPRSAPPATSAPATPVATVPESAGDNSKALPEEKKEPKEPQAQVLRRIAIEEAQLFCTPGGERYARIDIRGRYETYPISEKNGPFKRWLVHRYGELSGGAIPNATALSQAIGALEAAAQFGKEPHREVYLRVAHHQGKVYINLANDAQEVIRIDAQSWDIITNAPVCFRQPGGMLPLPKPTRGGDLRAMRRFINASEDDDNMLILAWCIGFYHPTGPFPILGLHGERGSAKSTATKFLRFLLDPNQAPARKEPEDARTLAIMAHNNAVIALDNLSHLPAWLSDALCRVATGAGDAYRKNYTDDDEMIFSAIRPIVLNGIEDIATRGDLLDRAIIVHLPEIPEERRKLETVYWQEATAARPAILGALCDAVSDALRNLPSTHIARLPRMADFAQWIVACEKHITPRRGAFLTAYASNRQSAISVELEASPVAAVLTQFMSDKPSWEGPSTDLLTALATLAGEEVTKRRGWPGAANALSGVLKRLAPSLRSNGIDVQQKRANKSRSILIAKLATGDDDLAKSDDDYPPGDEGVTMKNEVIVTSSNHMGGGVSQKGDDGDDNVPFFSSVEQKKKEEEGQENGHKRDDRKGREKTSSLSSLSSLPFYINCPTHGQEYMRQRKDMIWECTRC